ncbi:L-type lectin-domain containing receptor kinase VIII.1-like [Gastrolobium bilobum]|uniref:L-type lectin-domain containing receptor kinase VIII.1-like n=1 Tax=Gastrolobium bilobum TaxID=150636 RepID=UPI002AB18C2B|nr:L-type lectin-domain containing receptor kinase VIII.1-like [Gastrolobium bilobum]
MIDIPFIFSRAMAFLCYIFLIFCLFDILASIGPYPVAICSASDVPINVTKHFYFPDFSLRNNPRLVHDVKLLGSSKFSNEKGALQIPNESQDTDIRHQAGRGIYSFPIRLLDPSTKTPASFETTFSFQLNNSTNSEQGAYGGSGLTFIIVPDEFTVGRPGPWLAMLNDACEDDYKAVAVEFDTRMNPEFGDPNDNHVGINLGTIISTKIINVSDVGVSLKDGFVHRAWINYDGPQRRMDIRLGLANQEVYPSNPIFSESLDLSPYLNEYMFVGFSASTGNHTQIHNILSWNFTSTSQAFLRFPSSETCQGKILLENSTETITKKSTKDEPPRSFLIFVAVVALALAVFLGFYFISKHRRNAAKSKTSVEAEIHRPRPPNKPRRFTFSELSSSTRSYNEIELLGSDSRGVYYRGKLSNGSQVAVKRFSAQFLNTHGSDRRRLLKEIKTISQVRHPNLLPVRGWCQDNHEIMVVYEFVPNGSLDKWLFGAGVLPWTRRFKVIKDVADGLSFLHTKQLAHKNLKCSSVFLDVSFRAVLGDFGFVLLGAESKQFESAVCQGADVFEFGVLVLEVIAGRIRDEIEQEKPEERNLLDFAWNLHQIDEKVKLVDRRMGSLINLEQAIRVVEIGLLCTLNENKGRPSMEQVVDLLLNMEKPIPELPRTRPVALYPYNSANSGLCNTYSCTF